MNFLFSMRTIMPTNDQNVTLNPAQPQTDILSSDVDLDVSKNEVNDQASGFDFSLDLPDNFVTQPVQTPVEEPVNLNFDLNSETIQQQSSPVQMDFLAENAVSDSEVRSSLFTQDAQEENISEVPVESQQVVAPLEDSFPMPQETASLAETGSVENFEFKSETSTFLHQNEEEKKVENQTFEPVFSQEAPVSFVTDVSNESVANDAGGVESTPEVEMDPFEAMRATINAGAEFPVSESQPVTASSEEETISAPVENISLQDDVGESNLNTFTTPIVEPVLPQDSALDPMDAQLPAQSEASLSSTTPQMLSLDEMIAQPQPTTPSTQTINLDVMANVAANAPIDSAVPMAPAGIPVSTGNTKAILAIVASGIVVLMLAFVAFLRYPSEIASLFGMPNANPVVQPSEVETSLDQEDHGAAELT